MKIVKIRISVFDISIGLIIMIILFYFIISYQIIPLIGADDFIQIRSPNIFALITFLSVPSALFSVFLSVLIIPAIFEAAYITGLSWHEFKSLKERNRRYLLI